jgi:hypothetical protein
MLCINALYSLSCGVHAASQHPAKIPPDAQHPRGFLSVWAAPRQTDPGSVYATRQDQARPSCGLHFFFLFDLFLELFGCLVDRVIPRLTLPFELRIR